MSYSVALSQSLEILSYIELKTKFGEAKYLTIKQISEKLTIPVPSVKRLVGLLKRANLIESKKGVNGGLSLTRPAQDISLYEVFDAVEGQNAMFKIHENFDTDKFIHQEEAETMLFRINQILSSAEKAMHDELKKETLSDLFQKNAE
ncbi:Rrf2 family transcriptional regulator [Enterococcus sp. JM4C]|uniref:RrF2 family transcriptional regulator n=1 Tax=Candidatus Enterococcus huntleyi TaxID=1857217 RepID=UPI00137A3B1B|nr:Rrf2 family transcriptional regulator [Enterococcus sp. JM4C]KAF1297189.1 Rrf2 family transcriptional regulator [Enterococcus sp. JM4C]